MKYVLRKYYTPFKLKNVFKPCIGVLGEYDTKEDASIAFWKFQISEFRKTKDFIYLHWGRASQYKYDREDLINYINEKFPFHNEYFFPDKKKSLDGFKIPDEITDNDVKYLSKLTKLFYYEIFELEKGIVFYVPVTDKKIKDYNGNLKKIEFSYFSEGASLGTPAYVYDFFAREETERYLLGHCNLAKDEIKDSYELLEMSYQEYLDFRFNELSEYINGDYEYFKYAQGKDTAFEYILNNYQLPMEFLKERLE